MSQGLQWSSSLKMCISDGMVGFELSCLVQIQHYVKVNHKFRVCYHCNLIIFVHKYYVHKSLHLQTDGYFQCCTCKCIQLSLLHHDTILSLILYLCGRIKFIDIKVPFGTENALRISLCEKSMEHTL